MDHVTVILVLFALQFQAVESQLINSTLNLESPEKNQGVDLSVIDDSGLREEKRNNILDLIKQYGHDVSHRRLKHKKHWSIDFLNTVVKFVTSSDIFKEVLGTKNTNSTSQCTQDIRRLIVSAFSAEKWTIPFLDASGKPVPGMVKGSLNFVGSYNQCRKSRSSPSQNDKRPVFNGEYCVLTISNFHPLVKPSIGLCLPDSCSEIEIYELATKVIGQYIKNITVESVECRKGDTKITAATIIAIIILSVLGILIISGTAYDIIYVQKLHLFKGNEPVSISSISKGTDSIDSESITQNYGTISSDNEFAKTETKPEGLINDFFVCFSFYTNGKNLLNVTQASDSLSSLHGLRYLSMSSIILNHLYLSGFDYSINKIPHIFRHMDRWTFDFVVTSNLAVDTFFVISGLLVSYQNLKDMTKHGWRIDWPRFYYHRIWRLTPPYMIVLVIFLGLTQYIGEGALWSNTQPHDKKYCEDDWWKNLLYINNFGRLSEMCMGHSWYLSNNMQFYVFSPLILIPLHFHHVLGIVSCFVVILASWITTGVLSSENGWVATPIFQEMTPKIKHEYEDDYYIKPWCRIGPFILGIIAGYILTLIKGKSLKIKWWIVLLGWILSMGSALSVVYGLHGDISGDHPNSREVAALYNAMSRSVWGAAICWIVIACDAGYGGPVNTFLSWSPFVVLGRMTYMIYLIHPNIIHIFFDNMGYIYYENDTTMTIYFIGLLGFSTLAAVFFMLAFESPWIALEKKFLPKKIE